MKKTAAIMAIILILALCFSLFACRRTDEEGAADEKVADREITAPADDGEETAGDVSPATKNGVQPAADVSPVPQNDVQTVGDGSPVPPDDAQTAANASPVPPDDAEPAANASPAPQDDAEPAYTADMPFSPYEVVVTLTAEESAKNKTYTPADFPQVDVFNVFEYDYFPAEYYPDHADKKTLFLMLNEPGKENVLGAIRFIEEDERVLDACVNWYKAYDGFWIFTPNSEYSGEFETSSLAAQMREQLFDMIPDGSVIMYEKSETVMKSVREALSDPKIHSARQIYCNLLLNYNDKAREFYYDRADKASLMFSTAVKYDSVDEIVDAFGLRDIDVYQVERRTSPTDKDAFVLPAHISGKNDTADPAKYFYIIYWNVRDTSKDNKREVIDVIEKNANADIKIPFLSSNNHLIIPTGE